MSCRGGWRTHADLSPGGAIKQRGFNLEFDCRSRAQGVSAQEQSGTVNGLRTWEKLEFLWLWADRIIWFNLLVVAITPLVSLYGILTTPFDAATAVFCVACYVCNMIGMCISFVSHADESHTSRCL